jgi:hypothetical protein
MGTEAKPGMTQAQRDYHQVYAVASAGGMGSRLRRCADMADAAYDGMHDRVRNMEGPPDMKIGNGDDAEAFVADAFAFACRSQGFDMRALVEVAWLEPGRKAG